MAIAKRAQEFLIDRDAEKCIKCQACVRVCSNNVHAYDAETDTINSDSNKCVGCHFCEDICPTRALTIKRNVSDIRLNSHWSKESVYNIVKQAETGGVLLSGMGTDKPYEDYFEHIVLNASQVTNPSIDPLREPMELKTFIGRKPDKLDYSIDKNKKYRLKTKISTHLELESPIMFTAMSFGSISLNTSKSLAKAACDFGTYWNTGEGGMHKDLYKYAHRAIVQVASGRFGVDKEYLNRAAAIEIKIGQGAKPGIGGHLPGEKVSEEISRTRMIPVGTDALSPAPHHDIYSIEDLKQLIYALKEATRYKKPVGVKIAAVHNVAPIASGIVRAGADYVVIDGIRGGTGAAPTVIRDNVGIPIELAIATVDQRLREEGIRNQSSLIAAGGFRSSADIVKAIALGADAVYIGTSALIALGCHLCQKCYTGKCNWGIATQDPYLTKRLNPELGAGRLCNLLKAWSLEIKEMLGGMGINAIESLRGNREQLRAVGLSRLELDILGIKHAGESW
ncbi:MAG: FMN-binding glutamate synthase family protein [Elusimicrobia bacterium CG_4_10_14_0_8_um_filter_37_32]|nr:MAG: FMN-binding glutamate synthase family protein [Elusimicrobia bacterium CG02_land_8_20_14_3_00_37_13]PIZ13509.1 MAG: FMN-binding glutamate synthase family protein [Elusimicrobia bacterium CG_4_10_14_0_8_um_filter_37_32]